jgi:hypothetical protein
MTFPAAAPGYSRGMNDILLRLRDLLAREDGFVIGRVALVVVVLAVIIVAAVVALIVPN